MEASIQNDLNKLEYILSTKLLDINEKCDNFQYTALHYAAQNGHIHTMKLLLEHGADINATEQCGFTALFFCTNFGYASCVQLLLDQDNMKVNHKYIDGQTAFERLLYTINKEERKEIKYSGEEIYNRQCNCIELFLKNKKVLDFFVNNMDNINYSDVLYSKLKTLDQSDTCSLLKDQYKKMLDHFNKKYFYSHLQKSHGCLQ